jgi:hypothetical protein
MVVNRRRILSTLHEYTNTAEERLLEVEQEASSEIPFISKAREVILAVRGIVSKGGLVTAGELRTLIKRMETLREIAPVDGGCCRVFLALDVCAPSLSSILEYIEQVDALFALLQSELKDRAPDYTELQNVLLVLEGLTGGSRAFGFRITPHEGV